MAPKRSLPTPPSPAPPSPARDDLTSTSDAATASERNPLHLAAGVGAAIGFFLLSLSFGLPLEQCATAATAALCGVWWMLQPVPIYVTSLVPFVALPLFGVLDHRVVAQSYGHTLVLLLMAGFMLSTAIEACGAHRRLALSMTRLVGGSEAVSARRLLLGFMAASAVSSMWLSNTATTLILLPIALAASAGESCFDLRRRLLVGIAYAASIGGMGTPIGTPPNLLLVATLEDMGQPAWSFSRWMSVALPIVLVLLPLAYWVLARPLGKELLPALQRLGPASSREKRVLSVFALTAGLWVTRSEPFGGWSAAFGLSQVGDATVGFLGLLLLLLLPDKRGQPLLRWQEASTIPWGILLLFGGGIALAAGFKESGLSASLGQGLSGLATAPPVLMMLGVTLGVTFLTEVTSNTATTALLLPILGSTALAAGVPPEKLMVPATLSASCAFMLPVATAPNAIVFGSGQVSAGFLARQGLLLNFLGAVVISLLCSVLL